jgi:hypothetical protein
MKQIVNIQDFFPSYISTRKAINKLSKNVKLKAKAHYIFDFTNITFISRSFADEFLKYLKTADIKWQFKHINKNVSSMLKAVQHSQESCLSAERFNRNDYDRVAVTSFTNKKDLKNFLSVI